ncbi:root hair defective 3 GTP-binding protein [Ostreococcus tauri]|uniref:Protein ROOT HAIR DEFECTIVE 3 homolog n=1 Tax=Ostreococcus tauri TaxID=70448 RepID=A0A1Y5IM85_OSTTA|nr:root hair defective 3 GTP-binding protein [Ostreococcus tauri]
MPTAATQIVTFDGEYDDAALDDVLRAENAGKTFASGYQIVAIMGPQSSGKSTLLNHAFGTTFREMDDALGRSQTTQGVWLARSETCETATLVMDLEGTDGRERGEEDTAFEKQTALFAMATADVLLVNMWCNDIGREQASGKPLLRTIFEVNLKVFSPEKKTMLLFVIRDRSKTPFERLVEGLRQDLESIWRGITKPDRYINSSINDLFELKFTSLPHYEHEHDLFVSEAKALRDRFDAPSSDVNSLRATAPAVPISGLGVSMREVWATVKANKDLDLPAHKIMVATVRCEEIADSVLAKIVDSDDLSALLAAAKKGKIPQLVAKIQAMTDAAVKPYDEEAGYFVKDVREAKRVDLKVRIAKTLGEVVSAHLEHVRDEIVDSLANEVNATLGDASAAYALGKKRIEGRVGFAEFVKSTFAKVDLQWEEKLEEALPTDDLAWADFVVEETKVFQKLIDQVVDSLRKERMNLTIHACERAMERGVGGQTIGLLEEAPRDMWHRLRQMRTTATEKWDKETTDAVSEFEPIAQELQKFHENMRDRITEVVDAKARDAATAASMHMKQAFARVFSKDSKGLPRVWRPLDDVAGINKKAQREALRVLALLAVTRLDDGADKKSDDVAIKAIETALYGLIPSETSFAEAQEGEEATPSTTESVAASLPTEWEGESDANVVLSPAECRTLWLQFESDTLYAVSQAMAAKEAARRALTGGAPIWMIVLLMVLGMNEIKWLLTHPVTLFLLVAVGLYARAIYNQLDVASAMQLGLVPGLSILATKIIPIGLSILKKLADEGAASWAPESRERPVDAVTAGTVTGHAGAHQAAGAYADITADGVRRRRTAAD